MLACWRRSFPRHPTSDCRTVGGEQIHIRQIKGRTRVPWVMITCFFLPYHGGTGTVLFPSLWTACDDEGGGELLFFSQLGNVISLICIDMQMYQVTVELFRTRWCQSVSVCVPPPLSATHLGHCFFCCMCSLSDGYVLYLKPEASAAWAELFMMVQAACGCRTGLAVIGYISHCHWLMSFYTSTVCLCTVCK